MSLILEALRKLEREKRSSEPGFLVLGPTSWAGGTRRTRAMLALIAGLALLATALGVLAWRNAGGGSAPASRAAAAPPPASADSRVEPPIAYVPPAQPGAPLPMPIATPRPASAAAPAMPPDQAPVPADAPPQPARVVEPAIPAVSEPHESPPQPPQPRFRLQAISMRDGKPVAVLNDRLVYEGESVDGVTVIRIGEAEVELEVDGRRQVISF